MNVGYLTVVKQHDQHCFTVNEVLTGRFKLGIRKGTGAGCSLRIVQCSIQGNSRPRIAEVSIILQALSYTRRRSIYFKAGELER